MTNLFVQVGAYSPVFGSSKSLRYGSGSQQHSSPGAVSPMDATSKDSSQCKAASWTSVTETTFICTTAGCAKCFTTKRALIRHQKDKHGLVTRQMESDSDSAGGVL